MAWVHRLSGLIKVTGSASTFRGATLVKVDNVSKKRIYQNHYWNANKQNWYSHKKVLSHKPFKSTSIRRIIKKVLAAQAKLNSWGSKGSVVGRALDYWS